MSSIINRLPPIVVEYDRRGKRVRKFFANAYEARRFYAVKLKAEKNPSVHKVQKENES